MRRITREFKCEIGDNLKDEKRDITIIGREYRQRIHTDGKSIINDKWDKYKCNKCGWDEGWVVESALLKQKQGGGCCYGKVVVENINSIWATDRWMCDLGLSEQDAKTYTSRSGKKVVVTCPNCKKQKEMRIADIYAYKSVCCKHCSDGVSYPEKFVQEFLNQLNVEYKKEYCPSWSNKKRYDFYIKSCNTIIEANGKQHYDGSFSRTKRGRGLSEEQENDKIKHELAMKNGIDRYVVLDCRNSNINWIKNSILKSELNKIFDLTNIDWAKCGEFGLSNLIKQVCLKWDEIYKNEGSLRVLQLEFKNIERSVLIDYLKKGNELGLCHYDPKEEMRKSGLNSGKRVFMYTLNGELVERGISCEDLKRKVLTKFNITLDPIAIGRVCNGKQKTHKGYIFKYMD